MILVSGGVYCVLCAVCLYILNSACEFDSVCVMVMCSVCVG